MTTQSRNLLILTGVIILLVLLVLLLQTEDTIFLTSAPTEPEVIETDPRLGSDEAIAEIVYFGDVAKESSADVSLALIELAGIETNVSVVWKDYPNTSLSDEALPSAIAARCAHEQDAFWEYHQILAHNQDNLGAEVYLAIAEELELSSRSFEKCLESDEPIEMIEASIAEGKELNVTAAPTLFIGDQRITGTLSRGEIEAWILEVVR